MLPAHFYKTQDYRELIEIVFRENVDQKKRTFASAALFCKVQPTYFSNVLKGRADFSEDQIFSLCEYLELNETEANYLKVCHQWARSGLKERKKELQSQILDLKNKALSPATRLKVAAVDSLKSEEEFLYFLDPMHQVLAQSIELSPSTKELPNIAEALVLSEERTQSLVENLVKSGRIKIEGQSFKKAPLNYHLGSDSKILFQHQANLRQQSIEKMRQLKRKDFKAYSVTFSASRSDRTSIEEVLDSALEKIRKIVESSSHKEDSVYQLNFDFFPWYSNK